LGNNAGHKNYHNLGLIPISKAICLLKKSHSPGFSHRPGANGVDQRLSANAVLIDLIGRFSAISWVEIQAEDELQWAPSWDCMYFLLFFCDCHFFHSTSLNHHSGQVEIGPVVQVMFRPEIHHFTGHL